MHFNLEKVESIALATSEAKLQVFKHKSSDFRVIFVRIPGPLVSASIVIPTLCDDDRGLPHTLEHLIFCGSESYPFRGYLDNLSTRCLSTGTNAYTADDHTCYEITTAGAEGMKNIFPVFLDHILNPSLLDSQFLTEVYHLDHQGKHQGVVYCEMASRENTEADMLDLNIRQMIYEMQTTYSYECGGLTPEIKKLTNDDVKSYHKKFYHLDNTNAIICGDVDPVTFLASLDQAPLFLKQVGPSQLDKSLSIHPKPWQQTKKLVSKTVEFPSTDESIGSIAYGWRGPPSDDLKTLNALEILFLCLNDNPASLLQQKFIERKDPFSSDIDFEIKGHAISPIVLLFSGVPYLHGEVPEDESDLEGSEISEGSEDSEDSEGSMEEDEVDLFDGTTYHKLLVEAINEFLASSLERDLQNAIRRHRRKIQEGLEESPHEVVAMTIISDIVRHAFGDEKVPKLGIRLNISHILTELEKEPIEYWKSLLQKYLLDQPACEVKMIPSRKLEESLEAERLKDQRMILKQHSQAELKEIEKRIAKAVDDNKVALSASVLRSMPPVPNLSNITNMDFNMTNVKYLEDDGSRFACHQVIKTNAALLHFGIGFGIKNLPDSLRLYLVLFQELMFQSSMKLQTKSSDFIIMDYKEVARYASEIFISHECGVGFGNSIFSASYLSQVLTFFITGDPLEWERAVRFTFQVILFSQFTKDRIITIAKQLLTNITDIKRDGQSILSAVSNRVSLSSSEASKQGCNEFSLSIFKQEKLLNQVLKKLEETDGSEIISSLDAIREHILQDQSEISFLRAGLPLRFSLIHSTLSADAEIAYDTLRIWKQELGNYESLTGMKKRKYQREPLQRSPFPYFRVPFAIEHMNPKFSSAVSVAVGGLSTYYLSQFVPCDVLGENMAQDYFPVILLAEILTRAEGPLYTGIRGKGYAYGANLYCYLWSGQLSFELYRSSEPQKALLIFYDILKELNTPEGFDTICSDYELETAQASVAYRWASDCSTAPSIISTALRSSLQGFQNIQEYHRFYQEMYKVTKDDLKRVFDKYFKQFLQSERRTVLVTPMGKSASEMIQSFKDKSEPSLEFEQQELDDFHIE